MTIAVSLNVNAGLVLASDSASTLVGQAAGGQVGVFQIYSHAYKLFQISNLPIGLLTWGIGAFGETSVEELVHTFIPGEKSRSPLSVEKITKEFGEYIKVLYDKFFKAWPNKPGLGFVICGFSDGSARPEEYSLLFPQVGMKRIRKPEESGLVWNGEIEAITRLEKGFSPNLGRVFAEIGLSDDQKKKFQDLQMQYLEARLFDPTMPLQDAVDLARFLVETTIEFEKFKPGAPTCGGPIDVAIITKRDGFNWISRKSIA